MRLSWYSELQGITNIWNSTSGVAELTLQGAVDKKTTKVSVLGNIWTLEGGER